MPALGSDMDEGTLNEWLVKPGDTVTRGQVVAVVETTKAAVEIECWHDGTVEELLVPIGETVQVGTPLATLLAPGETAEPAPVPKARKARQARKHPAARVAPTIPPTGVGRRHQARAGSPPLGLPAARRIAASLDVDVDTVTGTGPQGAVTINDVEHAAASAAKATIKSAAVDRASQMRNSIAAAMSRSKREIPHYYLADEILMEKALAWLAEHNAERSITERVLPAVLQLKAVALAAQRFGEFNGFWRDDAFEPASGVHIGVAISLRGGGLVAPAIHDVPDKIPTN